MGLKFVPKLAVKESVSIDETAVYLGVKHFGWLHPPVSVSQVPGALPTSTEIIVSFGPRHTFVLVII